MISNLFSQASYVSILYCNYFYSCFSFSMFHLFTYFKFFKTRFFMTKGFCLMPFILRLLILVFFTLKTFVPSFSSGIFNSSPLRYIYNPFLQKLLQNWLPVKFVRITLCSNSFRISALLQLKYIKKYKNLKINCFLLIFLKIHPPYVEFFKITAV